MDSTRERERGETLEELRRHICWLEELSRRLSHDEPELHLLTASCELLATTGTAPVKRAQVAAALTATAQRHLRESEIRIVRQEALIERLRHDPRHTHFLSTAGKLLAAMHDYHDIVRRHLWEIEERLPFTEMDIAEKP